MRARADGAGAEGGVIACEMAWASVGVREAWWRDEMAPAIGAVMQ